jgi:hypothetical protein
MVPRPVACTCLINGRRATHPLPYELFRTPLGVSYSSLGVGWSPLYIVNATLEFMQLRDQRD